MRVGIIYVCINLYNGKRYIGQTCQRFENRKQEHINDAINRNSELLFHRALRKSGVDNFVWNILERNIPIDTLNEREEFYIEKYQTYDRKNGYNLTKGGDHSSKSVLSLDEVEEIKELLRNSDISLHNISEKYNIESSSISDINNGDTWFDANESYPIRSSIYDKKLKEEDILKIYDMLRDGVSFKDIGKIFNCSTTNISNINYGKVNKLLDESQYPICSKKFSHLTQSEVDDVVDLLINSNLSQQEIADKLGLTRGVVSNINIGKHKKIKGISTFPIRRR